MNLETLGAGLLLALAALFLWRLRNKRGREDEPERFNHSHWKEALMKKTRRRFRGTKWKLREGGAVAGTNISFFLQSTLGNFELICLDRTMRNFKSESSILDFMEETTRLFKARNGTIVLIYDDGVSADFARNAENRGVLAILADDLDVLAGLDKYIDEMPKDLTPFELRILEQNYSACMNLSGRFKDAKNLEQAIKWARRAINIRYGYSAHFILFSLLLDSGDWDGAEAVGNEGLSFRPRDSVGFFKGFQKIAVARENHTAAVEWAERWTSAEPKDALAFDNLASLYEMQKNAAAASQAISKALQLAPDHPGILRRAAKIALLEGNLPAALGYAERWILRAPQDGGAHEFQADVLLRQKNHDGASAAIAVALALQPNHWGFVRKSSIVALESGNLISAVRFAEQLVAMAPTDPGAYDHLSVVYLRASHYEEAHHANVKAVELDPANPNFQRRAADIQRKLGRPATSASSAPA